MDWWELLILLAEQKYENGKQGTATGGLNY